MGYKCCGHIGGAREVAILVCSSVLLVGPFLSRATEASREAALRKRVEEFYRLLQQGNRAEAEKYVVEESRKSLGKEYPELVPRFEIDSIQLDADGQQATVMVRVEAFMPSLAKPVLIPRSTRWRLVEGTWYVILPKQEAKPAARRGPPPPEIKFETLHQDLGTTQPGHIKTARFPFTNISNHVVTIAQVLTGCDCLKARDDKKTYKPGETGELIVDFDPAGAQFELDNVAFSQTITVKTDPGGAITPLIITCRVSSAPKAP